MEIRETELPGLLVLEPQVHRDDRGFFLETARKSWLEEAGIGRELVQDNHSRSGRGTLRGLHFQVGAGQGKLIRCARGSIWDVAVDLRRSSPTFGKWQGFTLDDEDHRQLWIPVGFAHGFCVTSDVADVVYRCTGYYDPAAERGIAWDSPELDIPWPVESPLLSDRDRRLPTLSAYEGPWFD